jgi:hypothetical protein
MTKDGFRSDQAAIVNTNPNKAFTYPAVRHMFAIVAQLLTLHPHIAILVICRLGGETGKD